MTTIGDNVLELLSSAWAELGAPLARSHQRIVVDPEPIISLTPHLTAGDARLLGLAFDWCRIHSGQISSSRISGIARTLPEAFRAPLERFNASLANHGVKWRPRTTPLDLEPQRERVALPMDRPALLPFRLRAIAGASTRADVLTRLLFAPRGGLSVAGLCPSGTSRRNAELVLRELSDSGIVRVHGSPRKRRFNLAEPKSFAKLIGKGQLVWWEWQQTLELCAHLVELDDLTGANRVHRVRSVALAKNVAPIVARLGLEGAPKVGGRDDAVDMLRQWAQRVTQSLAAP